jgi:hypothetical protein
MLLTYSPILCAIYFLNIKCSDNFTICCASVKNLYLAHEHYYTYDYVNGEFRLLLQWTLFYLFSLHENSV